MSEASSPGLAFGGFRHGVLLLRRGGGNVEWPATSANPFRPTCWAIFGEVDAIVVPRGIAFSVHSHGPSLDGRFDPVGSVVNPYNSGFLADSKICGIMYQPPQDKPHGNAREARVDDPMISWGKSWRWMRSDSCSAWFLPSPLGRGLV
jgi:hypothetical protein